MKYEGNCITPQSEIEGKGFLAPDEVTYSDTPQIGWEIVEKRVSIDMRTYAEKRAAEYPPIGDVVDAICKKLDGDSTNYTVVQAKRLAVKAKYPKE